MAGELPRRAMRCCPGCITTANRRAGSAARKSPLVAAARHGFKEKPTVTAVQSPGMTAGRTLTFAVASGLAVANLYWAQPLLEEIARTLGVTAGSAGVLVTVTQIGYA